MCVGGGRAGWWWWWWVGVGRDKGRAGGQYHAKRAVPARASFGTANVNVWFFPAIFENSATSRGHPPWYECSTFHDVPLSNDSDAWQLPPLCAASAPSPAVTWPKILSPSVPSLSHGRGVRVCVLKHAELARLPDRRGRPVDRRVAVQVLARELAPERVQRRVVPVAAGVLGGRAERPRESDARVG